VANETTYTNGRNRFVAGDTAWDTSTIGVLALETTAAGAYNPDLDTVTDLLAVGSVAEAVGTGYVRKTLGTKTVTNDDTNNWVVLDAADVVWTAANWGDVRAVVVYDEGGGTDSTRWLLGYYDEGLTSAVTNGGDFTYAWSANGIIRVA
jgi:hypothetical protein